jgi:hypothetical protein
MILFVLQDAPKLTPPWTFVYQKGEITRYRTYIKADGRNIEDTEPIKIRMRTNSKNEVKDVAETGIATWEQLDEKVALVINAMEIPSPAKPRPVTVVFGPNGMVVKRTNPGGDPFNPSEKSLGMLNSFPAPSVGVKPGDTWKLEVPNPVLKNRKLSISSTFLGTEKILGIDTVKCKQVLDFPTAYGTDPNDLCHVEATYWLDSKNHQLLRASVVTTNALLPFPTRNMEVRLLVSKIILGQNEAEDPDGEKLIAPEKPETKSKG